MDKVGEPCPAMVAGHGFFLREGDTMREWIGVVELESVINRLLRAQPANGVALSADLQALAAVYAGMILAHQDRIAVAALPVGLRAVMEAGLGQG
jgi:hypothetical protein